MRTFVPWSVLVLGLILTGVATAYVSATSERIERLRFDRWVEDARVDLGARMEKYVTLLDGVAGLFAGSERVTHADFRRYVDRLDLTTHYPGIRGVGFSRKLEPSELREAEAALAAERGGPFKVWPEGDRDEYHAIAYLEPEDSQNRVAIGFDMFTDDTRREAMAQARDTGDAAMSRRVRLVQDSAAEGQAGFLVYTPVYGGGGRPDSAEARRAALRGFAYTPFRAGELLGSVFPTTLTNLVGIRVFDGEAADPAALLHATPSWSRLSQTRRFHRTLTFEVLPGRQWTMEVASLPGATETLSNVLTPATLVGGALLSLMLFGVTHTMAQAHRSSERVAERLQASERALREADERLQMALAAGDLYAFAWDMRQDRIERRGHVERMLGVSPGTQGEFVARVHEADREHVARTYAQTTAGMPYEIEYRFVRPASGGSASGEVRWLREKAVVQLDEVGAPQRVIGTCADITAQKLIEQQLRALNETLEQRVAERTLESEQRAAQLRALAADLTQAEQRERRRLAQVLHDHLQQLLVAAMMRMGGVARKVPDEPKLRQGVEQVEELIRQAIEASRSLTIELSPPVLYDAGLGRGLEWLGRSMQEKHGLRVELEYDPDADPENEDLRAFLFQAIRELLFNIVKHAKVGEARVRLSLRERAGSHGGERDIVAEVEDDGPGFDPTLLRVKGAKAEHFGLFSIQQRLELLGGRMDVRSEPGKGTHIEMAVPEALGVEPDAAEPPEPPESDQQLHAEKLLQARVVPTDGAQIRVLLADDHEVLREGLAAMLETQPDMQLVGEASDGQQAIDLATRLRPDAVVLDVTMPKVDGIEAARRIKQVLPDACIVGLSMHEAQEMARAMQEAGAVAYLTKSGPAEELLAVLRAHCRRPSGGNGH